MSEFLQDRVREKILSSRYSLINRTRDILDNTLMRVSREEDLVIVCNVMNEMSLDLLYNGAEPKSHLVSYRSEKDGVLGGYIIHQDYMRNPSKIIRLMAAKEEFVFYDQGNDIVIVNKYNSHTSYLKAITNNNGDFLTSDLDVLAIGSKASMDKTPVELSYGMGSVLKYEMHFINKINNVFSSYVKKDNPVLARDHIPIIRHGPFNRYAKSKLEDIYFPIVVYHPIKGKFFLGSEVRREEATQELLKLMHTLNNDGYNVDIHPNWSE